MMHVNLVFWTIRWMSGGYHLEKQAVALSSWACCTKGLRCNIFLYWPNDIPQESFEIPRGQSSREGDIELGERGLQNSGELGLENFFKKVALVCSLCKRDVNVTNFFCSFIFSSFLLYFIILHVKLDPYLVWQHQTNYVSVSFFSQVQEIEKQNDKLNVQLKKLQVSFGYVFILLIILWAGNL